MHSFPPSSLMVVNWYMIENVEVGKNDLSSPFLGESTFFRLAGRIILYCVMRKRKLKQAQQKIPLKFALFYFNSSLCNLVVWLYK